MTRRSTGAITAHPNPIHASGRVALGATKLTWEATGTADVEVRIGAPDGPLFSRGGAVGSAETGMWVTDGMVFYLQDISESRPPTSDLTLASVRVRIVQAVEPATNPHIALYRSERAGEQTMTNQVLEAASTDCEWIVTAPNPPNARILSRFRMFGVLGTWMEADIVAATVRNAITQGCERVYLVDNGSTDSTVQIACREGAVLARSFATERYDESLRLRLMNEVVSEVSVSEPDEHIWWLFLDADEFAHGPWGMTLYEYLKTLDERFRIVGVRYINHYPSETPHYVPGRHPLDFQPLCEELSFPMCPSRHRKHPLQRHDKGGSPIECGRGFHLAHCTEQLSEPDQPAFLHHFPFRDETVTRRKLEALWAKDQSGIPRALESHDTHMLTRFRSVDAVYNQDWSGVENFIALDELNAVVQSPAFGVTLKPWSALVETEHQHVLRWYSMVGAWKYDKVEKFNYGDDTTYKKGIAFLDGHGSIEDWGCGFAHARMFVTKSQYIGIDGSSQYADKIVDLSEYVSGADCIFMRHVLEHNADWRRILANAITSFKKRMVLVIFTPLSETTRQIATSTELTSTPVPDISFRKEDLTDYFKHLTYTEESLVTDTQYGIEHVFYIRPGDACPARSDEILVSKHPAMNPQPPTSSTQIAEHLRTELDAWDPTGKRARFWWRDDDAVSDTPQLRHLFEVARKTGIAPALAVVPEHADDSLVRLLSTEACCVWQHGWGHYSYTDGEFGEGRAVDLMVGDALAGQRALDHLFGPSGWQRVFVPPNHLLSMRFKTLIPSLGYLGLSAGAPLTPELDHVFEVNGLDVMNWPERRLLGVSVICAMIAEELVLRRLGQTPVDNPIGILTHHLAFDANSWNLILNLFQFLLSHRAVEIVRADSLFDSKIRPATRALSPAGVRVPNGATHGVTVVLTSCGRQDLLERTLDSFIKYNHYPISEFIVVEDGEKNETLEVRYSDYNIKWLSTGKRVGQIAAIDIGYREVQTEYIFHCEDDWEFLAPGFIENSLAILEGNPRILQVWIRALTDTNNHPAIDYVFFADDVPYRVMQPGFHTQEWGVWHGFSFNPGLRRRSDYLLLQSFGTLDPYGSKKACAVEREVSEFYLKHGFLAAILADNDGQGYARHIGWGRRVASRTPELPA
jgi:glycosyltransferase involved in cell wall biosynthesis